MNAEAQSLNDNTIDTAKILKDFVNKLNDLIYKLNKLGYDTKELYKVHDMLRYEVLNEEYVKKLYNNHLLDETAKKIRVYDSILTDLSDQLDELHSKHFKKQDEAIYFTINKPTRDRRAPVNKGRVITHTISVLLSTALIATTGYDIKKSNDEWNDTLKHEKLGYFSTLSSEKDIPVEHSDDAIETPYVSIIKDYSKVGEDGYRTVKTYTLDNNEITNANQLNSLDLTNIEPDSVDLEFVNNQTSPEAFRTCDIRYSYSYHKSQLINLAIVGLSTAALILFVVNFASFMLGYPDDTLFEAISNFIYNNIISLAKYKQEMKTYVKWGNEYHEEMAKLKTLINKTCQRIDKTIIKCTDELAKIDSIRQTRAVNAAENADDEYSKAQEMLASRRKEKIKNITGIIAMLSGELSKLGDLTDDESEKLLHTISISEDMLFEKVDDHLKIRDIFLPILKFLNLSAINFDDVDIRGVDFQKSNAIVFLRKVYNRDASGAKFDNQNIPDWTNCDGVNLSSAILNEDPLTLINLDKAITDKNTIITSGFNNDNGRGIAN